MEPTNHRRVVRALEVTLGSGQPFSTFGPGLEAYPPTPVAMIGLTMPAEEVDRRIAERFARWVEGDPLHGGVCSRRCGRWPNARAVSRGPLARRWGIGSCLRHVEEGAPLHECVEEAIRRTRTFARRQASWFRRDPRIVWTDPAVGPAQLLDQALGRTSLLRGARPRP